MSLSRFGNWVRSRKSAREEPKMPQGFDVKVVRVEDIQPSQIPPAVKDEMWRILRDPTISPGPDDDVFGKPKMYVRNDGLETYAATTMPRADVSRQHRTVTCVDYDPKTENAHIGVGEVEDTFVGTHGFAELMKFRTYDEYEGQHLSYSRLAILNDYCFETIRRFVFSGSFAEPKGEHGKRSRSEFAAGQHVWEEMRAHLAGQPGRFVIRNTDGKYYFDHAFQRMEEKDVRQLRERLEQFSKAHPPANRQGDVLPQMVLHVEHALQLLKGSTLMRATITKEGSTRTLYAIPQHNAGALFFDDVDGRLSGAANILFAHDNGKNVPYVQWLGTLPDFRDMGINGDRLKRIAVYARMQGWPPVQTSANDLVNDFARKAWERLVAEGLAIRDGDKLRFLQ